MRYLYAVFFDIAVIGLLHQWNDSLKWQTAGSIGILGMLVGMAMEKVMADKR